ncbi:uncharacterized protein [Magallana gigas]|uniref:uncharacterized protein n=1 Tax=Magallana gigas TaxID=29159 RepID=UPI0033415129
MLFYVSCLCLYFIKEAYVTADEKCWKTEDIKLRTGGFIRCEERVIIVKDLEFYGKYGRDYCYGGSSKIYQIFNCTGLRNTCSTKDEDMLAIIDEKIEHCWGIVNVCIIFDCIPGLIENMMNSQALTRPLGTIFQVVHFSGILRCSIYGDISQIILHKTDSADILVRNQNGSRILECNTNGYYSSYGVYRSRYRFYTCTKNVSQVEAMEITIYSGQIRNITLIIKGVILYQCRNSTYVHETNDQIRKLMSTLNGENKCGWSSKDVLPWTTTLFSSVLSLSLTVIYVIKIRFWQKLKETHSKTISTVTSCHQGCSKVRSNVTDNNYETPHYYTEIQV